MIGRVLVKSIVDRRPIPARFAPSFFKFLLGAAPALRDLELYDRTLATMLQELLLKPVAGLDLFFDDPGPDGTRTPPLRATPPPGTVAGLGLLFDDPVSLTNTTSKA